MWPAGQKGDSLVRSEQAHQAWSRAPNSQGRPREWLQPGCWEFGQETNSSPRRDRTGTRDGFVEVAGRKPGREAWVWSPGVGQRCPLTHIPRASASHALLLPPARSMASAGRADRALSISSGTGLDLSHLSVPCRVTVHHQAPGLGRGVGGHSPQAFTRIPQEPDLLWGPHHPSPETCKGVAGPVCSGLHRVPPPLPTPHLTSPSRPVLLAESNIGNNPPHHYSNFQFAVYLPIHDAFNPTLRVAARMRR